MSNSTEKFTVKKTFFEGWDKEWVIVEFKNGTKWIPSFEDLYRIVVPIAECENEKYPPPKYLGKYKVLNFFVDSIKGDSFEKIAKKHKLPIRNGSEVVETNGANLSNTGA